MWRLRHYLLIALFSAVSAGLMVLAIDYFKVKGYLRPYYGVPHIELTPECPQQSTPASRIRARFLLCPAKVPRINAIFIT